MSLSIAILGAGSLGSAMGGVLAEAGHRVSLIARNREHVQAVSETGLTLVENGNTRCVALSATTDPASIGAVDLVVLLVKSFHTASAVEGARSLFGPNTTLLSLQNGLGHEDVLAPIVGRERVLLGKTYVGGQLTAPGVVSVTVSQKLTTIGELDGQESDRAKRIADAFTAARMHTTVSTNILGTVWDKLFVNVATGAVSAISGLPYGFLYQSAELQRTGIAAVAEAMQVSAALGIKTQYKHPNVPWTDAGAGLPFEFKASMLQSVERNSVTEIDFINGAVCRAGTRVGVATPVNDTLVSCVKGIEMRLLQKRSPPSIAP